LKFGFFILLNYLWPDFDVVLKHYCHELTFSTYKVIQKYVNREKLVVGSLEHYGVSPPRKN